MEFSGSYFKQCIPGALICAVIALSATFILEHYGDPQLLYAFLIGLFLHFLSLQESSGVGINFCAKTVRRIGVALLGIRITLGQVSHLGMSAGLMLIRPCGAFLFFCVETTDMTISQLATRANSPPPPVDSAHARLRALAVLASPKAGKKAGAA